MKGLEAQGFGMSSWVRGVEGCGCQGFGFNVGETTGCLVLLEVLHPSVSFISEAASS